MICTIFFPSQTLAMKGKSVLAQNGIPSAPDCIARRWPIKPSARRRTAPCGSAWAP